MNTNDTTHGDKPVHIIGLKLAILDVPGLYPAGNFIGAQMLFRSLQRQFIHRGILSQEGIVPGGPLNALRITAGVYDDRAALAIMADTLEAEGLRQFATLLKYHFGEALFLPAGIDPAGVGCGFTLEAVRSALAQDKAIWNAIMQAALRALQRSAAARANADPLVFES